MHFIVLCIGVLSYAYLGECTISGWTSPTQATADGTPATAILTLAEGYTGDLFTFAATTTEASITSYALTSQDPNTGIFEFAAPSTGVLTLVATKVLDYETSASHKLVVTVTDAGSALGTTTVTIAITNVAPAFTFTTQSIEVADATAANADIATIAATDVGATITYAITTASNTNTDFAIASGGVITTAKVLAAGTTASYALEITAVDNGATPATGTTTLVVCVGTCPSSCSGAAGLAAGVLSLIALVVIMLK